MSPSWAEAVASRWYFLPGNREEGGGGAGSVQFDLGRIPIL